MPFSPLGKGMLAGRFNKDSTFGPDDFRSAIPRFSPQNLKQNVKIAELVQNMADKRHTTPACIALAWLLAQGSNIVPIPGTKTVARLEENLGAADLAFSPDELEDIRRHLNQIAIVGARYPKEQEMLTGL